MKATLALPFHVRCNGRRLVTAAALGGFLFLAAAAPESPRAQGPLAASGIIQAREVTVASEFPGRVRAVYVDEGDTVSKGLALVALDDSLWQANLAQAEAVVEAAASDLAALKASPRPEEVAVAEAQVGQARAAQAGAEALWRDAAAIRRAPQELDARLAAARTQVATATQAVERARADLARTEFERDRKDYNSADWHAAEQLRQAAEHGLAAAQADLAAAQANLQGLEGMRTKPLVLLAAEHKAKGEAQVAAAAVVVAERRLEDLRAGPLPEEVAQAEAKLRLAQAQADSLRHQIARLSLTSPVAGLVLARLTQPGEAILPGAPLLRLADLRRVELVLFIPEPRIGQVSLGQAVDVQVDSYPGRTFTGHVTHIADRAEFTPRNVATREERINTYYAVRVALPNPEGTLKPGMAADAVLVR